MSGTMKSSGNGSTKEPKESKKRNALIEVGKVAINPALERSEGDKLILSFCTNETKVKSYIPIENSDNNTGSVNIQFTTHSIDDHIIICLLLKKNGNKKKLAKSKLTFDEVKPDFQQISFIEEKTVTRTLCEVWVKVTITVIEKKKNEKVEKKEKKSEDNDEEKKKNEKDKKKEKEEKKKDKKSEDNDEEKKKKEKDKKKEKEEKKKEKEEHKKEKEDDKKKEKEQKKEEDKKKKEEHKKDKDKSSNTLLNKIHFNRKPSSSKLVKGVDIRSPQIDDETTEMNDYQNLNVVKANKIEVSDNDGSEVSELFGGKSVVFVVPANKKRINHLEKILSTNENYYFVEVTDGQFSQDLLNNICEANEDISLVLCGGDWFVSKFFRDIAVVAKNEVIVPYLVPTAKNSNICKMICTRDKKYNECFNDKWFEMSETDESVENIINEYLECSETQTISSFEIVMNRNGKTTISPFLVFVKLVNQVNTNLTIDFWKKDKTQPTRMESGFDFLMVIRYDCCDEITEKDPALLKKNLFVLVTKTKKKSEEIIISKIVINCKEPYKISVDNEVLEPVNCVTLNADVNSDKNVKIRSFN